MMAVGINTVMYTVDLKTINEMAKKGVAKKKAKKKAAKRASESSVKSIKGVITHEELAEWLEEEFDIDESEFEIIGGKVNILGGDLSFDNQDFSTIPIPLGSIKGDLNASIPTIQSFKNFPHEVGGHFFAYDTQISQLKGLSVSVGGSVEMTMNEYLKDYTGIYRHIHKMNGTFLFDIEHVKRGGLGVMLINGVKEIKSGDPDVDKIFNKYLKGGKGDVFDVQEELIDAGFAKYARV
jgi:hypothetical protein